ncbi:MAG: SDR family oxidoreductase [Caldisericaceae bacterium]
MDLGLSSKVAFVMAGSKGLGKSVALKLAEEGADIAIVAHNASNLEKAKEEIEAKTGRTILSIVADVTKEIEVKDAVLKTINKFGTVHILFANAGGPPSGGFFDVSPGNYLEAVQLNLMSTIYAVYAIVPYMKEQKWGRIVASTSISVKQPLDNLILSNVSRAGVVAFVKSVSNALAPFGITANSIAPGYTMTERVENLLKARTEKEGISFQEAENGMVNSIPMGRIGTVEEFSSTVAFLCSENASYITGITLPVDGGFIKGV